MLNNLSELHDFIYEQYPYLSYTDDEYYYCARFNKLVLYFDKYSDLICIDNRKTYNKARQCPIKLRFPISEIRLVEAIEFAKTKKFIEASNRFLEIPRFNDTNNRLSDGYYGYQDYIRFTESRKKQIFVR